MKTALLAVLLVACGKSSPPPQKPSPAETAMLSNSAGPVPAPPSESSAQDPEPPATVNHADDAPPPDDSSRAEGQYKMQKPAPLPTVSVGQPSADGGLDKAIIRRYVKRNIQKIQYCYEKFLLSNKLLKGTVTVVFTIELDGKVSKSDGTGVDPEVASCVAGVIKDIEFPKPKTLTKVDYPFTFASS